MGSNIQIVNSKTSRSRWDLYEEGEEEPCAQVVETVCFALKIKGSGMPPRLFHTLDEARCWLEDLRDRQAAWR